MTVAEKRLELHEKLQSILGSTNVYYQPTESVKLKYPAIVYRRGRIDNVHADNLVYKQEIRYEITAVYRDPDDDLPIRISKIPRCQYDRNFISDNLNHDVFTLYY